MTTPLDRLRSLAAALPEVEERSDDGRLTWFVADQPFARIDDGQTAICVRTGDAAEQALLIETDPALYGKPVDAGAAFWVSMKLTGEVDWPQVEDRIARSWELVAPARLLEAGGR